MAVASDAPYRDGSDPIGWSMIFAHPAASNAASQINDIQDIEERQHGL